MSKTLRHFTETADWWKEGNAASHDECSDEVDSLYLTQLIKRELRKSPVEKLQQEMEEMKKDITALRAVIFPSNPPAIDDYDKWLLSGDAKKYAGMHIAFFAGEGVIESAPTAEELMAKLEGHPRENEVSFSIVPSCQVAIR